MKIRKNAFIFLISILIFTWFFYQEYIGFNLFLFELLVLVFLKYLKIINFETVLTKFILIALFLTASAVVIINSVLSIFTNILVFFIFTGVLIYPQANSMVNSAKLAFYNFFASQNGFFKTLGNFKIGNIKFFNILWKLRIFLIPTVIIIIFISIYSKSNPAFEMLFVNLTKFINSCIEIILNNLNIQLIVTVLFAYIINSCLYFSKLELKIIETDKKSTDILIRKRKSKILEFRFTSLKYELFSGIFLLIILNILILVINVLDVYWVWFNFEWNGELLKQFVHEGTYLLIFSILLSMLIVLYYFRGNINFYVKNALIKKLAYLWLVQNAILTLSVGIRNFWYIYYYSLAYKRIAVIAFLILTLYGLYTVFIKTKYKRTTFYLLRTNFFAFLSILVLFSLFNWDVIIARYNFVHSDKAYLHLYFMSELSDKALPYIDHPYKKIERISIKQDSIYPHTLTGKYITPLEYINLIENKKYNFRNKWEEKGFFSWNFAEYRAYNKLFKSR